MRQRDINIKRDFRFDFPSNFFPEWLVWCESCSEVNISVQYYRQNSASTAPLGNNLESYLPILSIRESTSMYSNSL